jgi:hypothetical protein
VKSSRVKTEYIWLLYEVTDRQIQCKLNSTGHTEHTKGELNKEDY